MSEFYRCSICGNPMFAGYLCPKCSANGLKSCEVKTTNWQEQKTIAELQKRIDELEAQLAQVAKENDWMKYPEPPESGAK
jgi:uncharacterized Zn finger protein (UPF0148 family)